jgi:hypothetical protein
MGVTTAGGEHSTAKSHVRPTVGRITANMMDATAMMASAAATAATMVGGATSARTRARALASTACTGDATATTALVVNMGATTAGPENSATLPPPTD